MVFWYYHPNEQGQLGPLGRLPRLPHALPNPGKASGGSGMKLIKSNMAQIEADFAAACAKGSTDVIVFDETLKRFGLRLRASGRRSWIIQYEKWGRSRRVTLGNAAVLTPEQAKHLAVQELAKVDTGTDVAGDRAKAKIQEKRLLKSVIEQYLQARKGELRETTFREVTRYLRKTLKPLHNTPITAIERVDIASILREQANKSRIVARQARSVATTFFGWAVGEGFIERNPVIDANKFKGSEARKRVLKDAELAAVWNACADDEYGKIVRLLILTGARRDEIGGMTWDELRERPNWILPAARAKNDRELMLPLPPLAWDIIETVSHRAFNKHLFGIGKNGFNNWHFTKKILDQGSGISGWLVHDLRRSTATGMANIGIQPHIIEAVLNHVSGHKAGVAGIYNRSSYEREVRNALALWADHIRSITDNTERKVIPISRISGEGEPAA
jgi:integrase